MQKYTQTKVIRITETQYKTLKKLEKYNVRVCDFMFFYKHINIFCIFAFVESSLQFKNIIQIPPMIKTTTF